MASQSFNLLLDGRIFMAVQTLYEVYFGMWFIVLLYLLFKTILFIRTKNVEVSFVSSILFLGAVTGSSMLMGNAAEFIDSNAFRVCVTILIFELAAILYSIIWKK